MLGKLIKHEFKITSRFVIIILAILAIVTPVTAAYLRFSSNNIDGDFAFIFNMFNGLSGILYFVAMIGAGTATTVIILYRFYKSMVSSEGYLTHTLPVKTSSIIISKLIVGTVWTLLSYLMMLLSILVFTRILGFWEFKDIDFDSIRNFINSLYDVGFDNFNVVEIIILLLTTTVNAVIMYFVCFAIGQRMNGHPLLGAILTYIVITIIIQILSSVLMVIFTIGIGGSFEDMTLNPALHYFLIGLSLFNIVTGVLYYYVTIYMFKKKLNI